MLQGAGLLSLRSYNGSVASGSSGGRAVGAARLVFSLILDCAFGGFPFTFLFGLKRCCTIGEEPMLCILARGIRTRHTLRVAQLSWRVLRCCEVCVSCARGRRAGCKSRRAHDPVALGCHGWAVRLRCHTHAMRIAVQSVLYSPAGLFYLISKE